MMTEENSTTIRYPFEVGEDELQCGVDSFVAATVGSLQSYFLTLPKGDRFVSYDRFSQAYEVLRQTTGGFQHLTPDVVKAAVRTDGLALVVLRTILGLSPPEWANLTGVGISQGFARSLDQRAAQGGDPYARLHPESVERVDRLIATACRLLQSAPAQAVNIIHRLDKVDTEQGLISLWQVAQQGVPYPRLLYERLLGRPFASHRDSVSGIVGNILEDAIEALLKQSRIPYHRTGRAEQVPEFDQSPDFLIPSADSPAVVIEAKLTEDDGTARDKITRIQHLCEISDAGPGFEVIACIDGRGFSIRRNDMRKLLLATRGKVFTAKTLPQIVSHSRLKRFIMASEPD